MVGCSRRQTMWKVLVPSATPTLMVGVNQVIIASMIGARGPGYDVLTALRRLDIGGGIESGLAIVSLAITPDRVSQAFATRTQDALPRPGLSFTNRHPWPVSVALITLGSTLAGIYVPALQS